MVVLVIIYGWLAGIVVNALADDLPRRVKPSLPHYPDGEARPWIAWSGITAFLSGYWASSNGVMLKARHIFTEIGVIILCVMTYTATTSRPDASGLQIVFWLLYAAIFALVTVIDMEHRLILFVVINPFVVLAILDAVLTQNNAEPVLLDALLGGALGYGIFFLMYQGGFLFTALMGRAQGREITEVAFGYGDVMLSGVVGLILGWKLFLFSMTFTILLGAAGALIYIVARKLMGERYVAFTPLPYGPYIVAGAMILILYPAQVGALLIGR